MNASAGRILIMPKGEYDSSVTYEMLDLVYYKGSAWLAKKTVVGIEPSEDSGEHWHKLCDSTDLSNYLSLEGGNLRGQLGFGNGMGTIAANEHATYVTAFEDETSYRSLKVVNPITKDGLVHLAQVVNCEESEVKEYNLFGEHNVELLLSHIVQKANGGTMQFVANPNGNNYVVHRFDVENLNDVVFFGNVLASESIYVSGINVINFQPSYVEVKFWLNQPYNGELTFATGYLKSLV